MKKQLFKFKWLLLSIVLSIASVNPVWAGWKVYYGNTTEQVYLHLWNAGEDNTSWGSKKAMSLVPGTTNVWVYEVKQSSSFNCIFCKSQNGDGKFNEKDITVNSNNLIFSSTGTTGTAYTPPTFTVSYNTNGGSGSTSSHTGVAYNASVTLRANGFTRSNYTFAGWNTASDGTGTYYAPGASYTVTANRTFYAMWVPTAVLGGTNVMAYCGELTDWNQSTYKFTNRSGTQQASVAISGSTKVVDDTYKTGVATLASNTTYYNQGHSGWNSGLDCKIQAGYLYVVRNSKTSSYFTQKDQSGSDYLYEVSQQNSSTAATRTVTTTLGSSSFAEGTSNLSVSTSGGPGKSVLGRTNKLLYFLYNGSTWSLVQLSAGNLNVSSLTEGSYSLASVLTDGYIYVRADKDDFNVYAVYSIAYKDQGNVDYSGSNLASLPTSYNHGTGIAALTAGEKTGYNFGGWFDNSGCTGDAVTSISSSATGNKTFYAKWTAKTTTITLNNQGATTAGTEEVTATFGSAMPAITPPKKDGYTFGGYWGAPGGSGPQYYNADGSSAQNWNNETSTYTLYAKWTENMSTVLLVASPTGKGSFTIGGAAATSTTAGVATTRSVTAVAIPGYHFVSWAITGGATISSTSTNPTTVTGGGAGTAATLTATFAADAENYTMTYGVGTDYTSYGSVSEGHSYASGSLQTSGTEISLTATPATHYKLEGWYSNAACSSAIDGAGTNNPYEFTLGANTSVYAKFILKQCTITLNKNGGSTGASSVTASHGSTLPAFTAHSRTGYTLDGYYTDPSTGTKIIDASGALVASTTYANASKQWNNDATSLTLYAHWTAKQTTVTLNQQSGSGGTTGVTATYDAAMPDADMPTRTGYTFGGYYTETAGSGTQYYTNTGASARNWNIEDATKTLYAKWTVHNYTITYHLDEGTNHGSNPATYTIESSAITLQNPTKYGYDFDGWYTNEGKTIEGHTIAAGSHENKEFWAKWTAKANVTIKFKNTGNWSAVHAYAWEGKDTKLNGNWPGGQIYESDGWYTYSLKWGANIIINNGNGIQSQKIISVGEDACYVWDGSTAELDTDCDGIVPCNTKILYVKVPNDWNQLNLYTYSGTGGGNGNYPGLAGEGYACNSTEAIGGSWYKVTINTKAANFILTCNGDSKKIPDDELSKFTTETCWEGSHSNSLRSYTCPEIPTVTNGSGASNIRDTQAQLNGTASSDPLTITEYGFYYSSSETTKEGLIANGTKVIGTGSASSFNYTATGLSNATTYYYIAYAVNGKGTGYADSPSSFTTKYQLNYAIGDVKGTSGSISSSPATSSGSYVANGTTVTLTAPDEKTGYTWKGWYGAPAGTGDQLCATKAYAVTVSEDKTLYACYTEDMHTVALGNDGHGHVEIGGATVEEVSGIGVATASSTITAVPDDGYYFVNWTGDINDGVTLASGSATSASITIRATADSKTLTANFAPDEKIYFDNTYSKWSNVYVYLFNDNTYWTNSKENGVHPKDHLPTGFAPVAMTKVAGTDNLYEYAYHTSSHNYSFSYVAFSEVDMHNYNVFGKDKHAVYRGDWHKNLPVYVATEGYERVQIDKDDAAGGGYGLYHSGGYWRPYNPKAGESVKYYLDVFSGTADFQGETQFFKASGDGSLVAEVSARLTDANTTYTFGVHSDAGGDNNQHYAEGTTITNENSDNYLKLYKYNSSWNISVKTTSEGIYTFVLSMEYDSLRFSVIYPASVGDYRLTYSYDSPAKTRSSDIIKKKVADTGVAIKTSMYVDPTNAYSQLILERCSVITDGKPVWETRKTFDHSYITSKFATKEVYEMDVTVSGTNGTTSTLSNIAKYTGPFYIKTDCAIGGWADYTKNAMDQNSINYSALDSKTFNYYFVKYIEDARKKYGTNGWDACNLFDNAGNKTNVKCVVANMYNNSISDTLKSDVITGDGQETLPMPGSVRFSYNSATNEIKRTYLNGSTCWADAYLLLTADKTIKTPADVSIAGNATTFADKNNWVYELQIKAPETTKVWLKATFNSTPQDLIGTSSSYQTLIGGSNADHYQLLRIIYDFKTNKLIAAWEPDQGTVYSGETIDLASDVLMIHNRRTVASATEVGKIDDVTMINLTTGGGFTGIGRIYCAMRFQKTSADGFVGLKTNTAGSEATALTSAESYYRFNYWISFPYDVKMTDIFGIDGYGSKWRIQRYRGDLRAQNGWYLGDGVGSFWETVPMSDTEKLNAKEGYVLQLSPSSFRSSAMWNNSATERYLYFPSGTDISVVGYTESSVTLTSLPCTKGTFSDPTQAAAGYSHNITDSHWHVFGIPTFYNATGTTGTGTYHNGDTDEGTTIKDHVFYFYEYNNNGTTCNTYTATSSSDYVFQPMHAYMIQMTGELNFTINSVPASMAARRINNAQNYDITVELTQNETVTDRAFISIRDSASADFAFNEDMMKIHNSGKTNIYSFAGPYDVAANVLPKENRSIKLGIEASESGMYTIHVPGNFSGIATLFDNVENKRTNLALEDYEIFLEKGKYEDRFFIEIDLNKMPTAIDGVSGGSLKDGKAHKFIQNGQMYILQNGIIYDAQGKRVK